MMTTPPSSPTDGQHMRLTGRPHIDVRFCIPDDQLQHAPRRRRAPSYMGADIPLPRAGEFVYLSSTSAWVVSEVVHEWRAPIHLVVQVWLQYAGGAHAARSPEFARTQ